MRGPFFERNEPKIDDPSSPPPFFRSFETTAFRQPKRVISFENRTKSSRFEKLRWGSDFSRSFRNAVPADESEPVDAPDDRCEVLFPIVFATQTLVFRIDQFSDTTPNRRACRQKRSF